jgi:hypothetical protein
VAADRILDKEEIVASYMVPDQNAPQGGSGNAARELVVVCPSSGRPCPSV